MGLGLEREVRLKVDNDNDGGEMLCFSSEKIIIIIIHLLFIIGFKEQ